MPAAPPARPHTSAPSLSLNPSIFPRPSEPPPGPSRSRSREAEWEDAWDSGSDHEDESKLSGSVRSTKENGKAKQFEASESLEASFQHLSHSSVDERETRGQNAAASSAVRDPISALSTTNGSRSAGTKLPPGGAWEIVESLPEEEVIIATKVGAEAVREDADEIMRGWLPILLK